MKKEDSKLLLGLCIGLAAGAAIAYFSQADNRTKFAKGVKGAKDKLKDHLDSMMEKCSAKEESCDSQEGTCCSNEQN